MAVAIEDVLPADWLDLFDPLYPRIGLGLDPATTTKAKSNPSAFVAIQQLSLMYFARLVVRFKTDDPEVTKAIMRLILTGLKSKGMHARRLCIAATNERFFAAACRREFAALVPVQLVIESEKTEYLGEEMLYKAYLGNLVVNTVEDGYLPLPPEPWLKKDIRQVVRDKGTFNAEVEDDGGHGDCFVGLGLALHALKTKGGPAEASAASTGSYGAGGKPTRKLFNRYASRYVKSGRAQAI